MHSSPVAPKISNDAIEWFSKLHSGRTTPGDRERFERWRGANPVHAKAYADVEKFRARLDEPARRVFEQEDARTLNPTDPVPSNRNFVPLVAGRSPRRAFAACSLAAAVGMALWFPGVLRFWTSDYYTGYGERRELTLADGSRVSLNTHSALSVEFSSGRWLIELLEGEAYFQVAHNPARPFVVRSAHSIAKVTGTAFNLYAQAERIIVTVSEGRVKVYSEDAEQQAVELTAGLQTTGDINGIGPVLRGDARQATAWREGFLVFNMQSLSYVVDELNRYLPGKIMIADPSIGERIVSGAFDLTRPHDVITAIEKTLGLSSLNLSGALTLLHQPSF